MPSHNGKSTLLTERKLEMKRKADQKEAWKDFEKRIGLKRTGNDEGKNNFAKVPAEILVQRMSTLASGRAKNPPGMNFSKKIYFYL